MLLEVAAAVLEMVGLGSGRHAAVQLLPAAVCCVWLWPVCGVAAREKLDKNAQSVCHCLLLRNLSFDTNI